GSSSVLRKAQRTTGTLHWRKKLKRLLGEGVEYKSALAMELWKSNIPIAMPEEGDTSTSELLRSDDPTPGAGAKKQRAEGSGESDRLKPFNPGDKLVPLSVGSNLLVPPRTKDVEKFPKDQSEEDLCYFQKRGLTRRTLEGRPTPRSKAFAGEQLICFRREKEGFYLGQGGFGLRFGNGETGSPDQEAQSPQKRSGMSAHGQIDKTSGP
ncbi:hypothetical protein JTB14_017484, partial [Gonioctena quinquepunctata]